MIPVRFAPLGRFASLAVVAAFVPACAAAPSEDETDPTSEEVGTSDQELTLRRAVLYSWLLKSADLALDGRMRFFAAGSGLIDVQVDVTNVGSANVTAESMRVRIDGRDVTAGLWRYNGSPSDPQSFHTIAPGGHGYLKASLPAGALANCRTYQVSIDLDRTAQSGVLDPFRNDTGDVATPCLEWTTPVDSFSLDGQTPDPLIAGKSLRSIVSSIEVGRSDGRRCSYCHYSGSGRSYSPNVARDAWALIGPNDTVSGRTWAQPGGWADRFNALTTLKPYHLRSAFATWKRHGAR